MSSGQQEETPLLSGNNIEQGNMEKPKKQVKMYRNIPIWRWLLGCAYMVAMGICGIVLVALGSTLDDIAENCGTTSTKVGSVFIARGCGAVFGAVVSAKLYKWFNGNYVMTCTLIFLSTILMYMPFLDSVVVLHVVFALLGIGTAVTDTGCQIMSRKIHGFEAGPWLGANTVVFGIAGALVPLIEIITESLVVQYACLATICICGATLLILNPIPEEELIAMSHKKLPIPDGKKNIADRGPKEGLWEYCIEFVLGCMVFFLIGGKVTITAYIDSYIDDTDVVSDSQESLAIMALWIAIAVGRLVGLQDQIKIKNDLQLYDHLSLFLLGGTLSMLLTICAPDNVWLFWISIIGYGFFNGPCVGYCYDINNRLTNPSEKGMSIVMFGLNFGASMIPYSTAEIWDVTGPSVLIIVIFFTMLLPLPLLSLTKRLIKRELTGTEHRFIFC